MYVSHSVICKCLQPHGLYPARLLCPWDSPGKNTGVVCHFLLQRGTQGSPNPEIETWLPTLQPDSLLSETPGCRSCQISFHGSCPSLRSVKPHTMTGCHLWEPMEASWRTMFYKNLILAPIRGSPTMGEAMI